MSRPSENSRATPRLRQAAVAACVVVVSTFGVGGLPLHGVGASLIAGQAPFLFQDTDHDGLSDAFEAYLAGVSTDPGLHPDPLVADTDGDQLPDGFEYCLSGGRDVTSSNRTYSIIPTLTLASYQSGSDLLLALHAIPGDLVSFTEFHFLAAVNLPNGPVVLDLTSAFAQSVDAVGGAVFGPYSMAVLRVRIPVAWIESFDSVTFAAGGTVAGVKCGDTAIVSSHNGHCLRWRMHSAASGFTGGTGFDGNSTGDGEPQGGSPAPAVPNAICRVSVNVIPTGIPGVNQAVSLSAGCQVATWVCYPSECALDAAAGATKLVLDVLQLF